MKKLFNLGVMTALIAALLTFAPALDAQTTVQSTTTSASVSATASTVSLTSGTQVAVGSFLYVDRELMLITDATTTTLPRVQRGYGGTRAAAHASGAVVFVGVPARFYNTDVAGTCTSTSELFLPRINPSTGNIFQCTASKWTRLVVGGIPNGPQAMTTYTADGAISIEQGVAFLSKAGVNAMTLADPAVYQNGMTLTIISTTAQLHTVTNTTGFGGGTTARDVATFGAAVNNSFTIVAIGGVWYPIAATGVTIA